MILHYLKLAWRNLLKYRTQTAVSILGLAMGLTCFVFAALWIRHEMSFDSAHEGADRIYALPTNWATTPGHAACCPYCARTSLKWN